MCLTYFSGYRLAVHGQGPVQILNQSQDTSPRHRRHRLRPIRFLILFRVHLTDSRLSGRPVGLRHKSGRALLHTSSHQEKQGKGAQRQRKQLSCHCLHSYGYKIMSTKMTSKATVCYFCYHIVTNLPV